MLLLHRITAFEFRYAIRGIMHALTVSRLANK